MPDVGSVKYQVELDNSKLDGDISKTESEISSKLDKISGTLSKSLGYQVFKDIGAGFVQMGKEAIGFAQDAIQVGESFDKSMAQVAATMGMTVDEIGELRDFAQEMGRTTQYSASQAADALNYMALAGYDAETAMSMMPNVLNLAAAGDMELARASDMVTDASSALGLTLEQTEVMVDQMAKAASKSNTSVTQLGDAILTVGGTAKQMAGGTTELSTALGIMADSGIKGAEAGTHMRNILLSLNPTTEAAYKTFQVLGVNAYDANGNLKPLRETFTQLSLALEEYNAEEQTLMLSNLFNKTDLAAVDALLSATAYDFEAINEQVKECGVNWDNVTAVFAEHGEVVEDVAAYTAKMTAESIAYGTEMADVVNWLMQGYGMTREEAELYFNSVSAALDDQGNRWSELTGYIDDAAGAAQTMAETQMDNLAGDITYMESALEGVKIAISDALTPTLREFVQFGTGALSDLATAFNEGGLSGAVDAFGEIVTDGVNLLVSKAPDLVKSGISLIAALGKGLLDSLPTILDAAMEILFTLADGLIDNIPHLIDTALTIITKLAEFIINNADRITEKGVELIAALTKGLILAIPDIVAAIPKIIQAIWEVFENTNWLSIGWDIIRGIASGIAGAAGEIASAAMDAARNALDAAKSFLGIHSPSKRAAEEIGEPYAEGVAEGIDDGMDEIDESIGLMGRGLTTDIHLPDIAGYARDLGAAITASSSTQITVVSELDGREIARGTAWYMNEQLAWEAR